LPDGTFIVPAAMLAGGADTGRRDSLKLRDARRELRERSDWRELEAKRDWPGLVALAQAELDRAPQRAEWWYVKGVAQAGALDWRGARASFGESVRLEPDALEGWHMLAQAQGEAGDRATAIRTLERALDIDRAAPLTHFFLGEQFRRAGRRDEARAAYREALRLDSKLKEAAAALTQLAR
jgi:tetratricopeptide (TPR) repeat protein